MDLGGQDWDGGANEGRNTSNGMKKNKTRQGTILFINIKGMDNYTI
jgi:hypothetical protein